MSVIVGSPAITRFSDQPMSYSAPLTGDHFQRITQVVNARFDQADAYARSRYERFYRYEKLIHMVSKKKLFDWKANAFLPYALSLTEQSSAMKWLSLFLTRPYVTVQARRPEFDDIAIRRQGLIDWHLTGDVDVQELAKHMLRISERYGTSLAVVTPEWDTSVLPYVEREDLPTALGPVARMSWKMRQQRNYKIRAFHIDNTDFKPQPGKLTINGPRGMRWLFRSSNLTLDELRTLEKAQLIGPSVGGQSVEEIKTSQPQEFSDYKLRRLFITAHDDVDYQRDLFDKSVDLIEAFMCVPREMLDPQRADMEEANGLDPTKRIFIVANKQIVLEDVALPWDHGLWPFIKMDCMPDPYDFWGKGKIEPAEHMIYSGNEIMNMRLDNVKQLINALVGVDGNRMPPGWKRRLVSQPFGVYETIGNPSEIIQRLPMGDVTQSSYTEQQQLWTLIQEGTGLNEQLTGAPGRKETTLGEQQLKAETASKRIQFELVGSAKQLLGWPYGLSAFIVGLDRQYLPFSTYMNVVQPETPDDFVSMQTDSKMFEAEDEMFTYMATGATEGINNASKRADMAQMLQSMAPFLQLLAGSGFDFTKLIKYILKLYGQEPSGYFPPAATNAQMQGGMAGPGMSGVPMQGQPQQPQPTIPQGPAIYGQQNPAIQQAIGAMARGQFN